jgi:hypothetical protein
MAKRGSRTKTADKYKALLDKVQGMELGSRGFWKPSVGRSTVRILPPVGDMEFFFHEVGQHYVNDGTFFCPKMCTDGEQDCPICEVNEELWAAGEKDAAKDYRPRRSFWMNVIVRGEEGAGPRIFTPGITVFNSVVALISDPDYGDISDEYDGTDISIDRTGEGLQTEYQVIAKRQPTQLADDEDLMDEWLEAARDIQKHISASVMDYDELMEKSGVVVFFDTDDVTEALADEDDYEDDEELEDEPASERIRKRMESRTSRRRSSRRRR